MALRLQREGTQLALLATYTSHCEARIAQLPLRFAACPLLGVVATVIVLPQQVLVRGEEFDAILAAPIAAVLPDCGTDWNVDSECRSAHKIQAPA